MHELLRTACPLCLGQNPFTHIRGPENREYWLCPNCNLIFMDRKCLPTRESAEERYKLHQNGPHDPGYRRFLSRAIEPALPHLNGRMQGLDYGCGPVPTLSGMLESSGLHCDNYDALFHPEALPRIYDFIFATEVIEHFAQPDEELRKIISLMSPGGIWIVMTEPWTDLKKFAKWHYAGDFTHVGFYHAKTFDFICDRYRFATLDHHDPRVWVLMKK